MTSLKTKSGVSDSAERVRKLHTILKERGFVERADRASDASLFTRDVRIGKHRFHVDVHTAIRSEEVDFAVRLRGYTDETTGFLTTVFPERDHRTADTLYLARLARGHELDVDAIISRGHDLHIAVERATPHLRNGYFAQRLLNHLRRESRGFTLADAAFLSTVQRTDESSLVSLVRSAEQGILTDSSILSAMEHIAIRTSSGN